MHLCNGGCCDLNAGTCAPGNTDTACTACGSQRGGICVRCLDYLMCNAGPVCILDPVNKDRYQCGCTDTSQCGAGVCDAILGYCQ